MESGIFFSWQLQPKFRFLYCQAHGHMLEFSSFLCPAWEALHKFTEEIVQEILKERKLHLGAKFSLEGNGKSPLCDWWLMCIFIFSSLAVEVCIYKFTFSVIIHILCCFFFFIYMCKDALAWFCRKWVSDTALPFCMSETSLWIFKGLSSSSTFGRNIEIPKIWSP